MKKLYGGTEFLMSFQRGIGDPELAPPAEESDDAPDGLGARLAVAAVAVATLIVLSLLSAICSITFVS